VASAEHHPLDELARELGRENVSRKRALKLIGAALAGAAAALIPGVASAAPPEHVPPGRPLNKPEQGGFGAGGRFGKGGPLEDTCGGNIVCSSDSDCVGGCTCSCIAPQGFFLCCNR
jgi:hypothetical protein